MFLKPAVLVIFFCILIVHALSAPKTSPKIPLAFILAVFAIAALEAHFCFFVPREKLFSHEVDRLLYEMEHKTYDADLVLLGDSVGGQVIRELLRTQRTFAGLEKGRVADLSTNQAVEMIGHYFLLKRYFKKNKKPKAVVFISLNPLGRNLEQVYTENFVKRCFTNWSEIAEISFYKGMGFGLSMVFYKFFPIHRYRLRIQNYLFKSKKDVYRGEMLPVLGAKKSSALQSDLSYEYLLKTMSFLQKRGIDFYFLEAPQSALLFKENKTSNAAMAGRCMDLEKRYSRFHFIKNEDSYPDTLFYPDKAHFTQEGIRTVAPILAAKLPDVGTSFSTDSAVNG